MTITYRDELGFVQEIVDEYGVSFSDGNAYFNDKCIPMSNLVEISE